MKNLVVMMWSSVSLPHRPLCGALCMVAMLSGCAPVGQSVRTLERATYDAAAARAEAARVDPDPLRQYFPDAAPPVRMLEKGSLPRKSAVAGWSLYFVDRLRVAAAPMCGGGVRPSSSRGDAEQYRESMVLRSGKSELLYTKVGWVAPYAQNVDGARVGDVRLHDFVLPHLPDDEAMRAHLARMSTFDKEKFEGVLRDGEYVIVERRDATLGVCRFNVIMVEDQLLNNRLVRHRAVLPNTTTLFERVLDVFQRDEDLQWLFTHEYAAGIVPVMFGAPADPTLQKDFSLAVEKAIIRMAGRDGVDGEKILDKVMPDPASTYYLALYIGHNATLVFEDYLSQLRISDQHIPFATAADAKAVEYRERLLRHWWDELRAQHAPDALIRPDPRRSMARLDAL